MDKSDPVDILARTIWGEARGDGRVGMTAVANVIVNRANNPRWWGQDISTCCLAPWQFSCWNENDPNLAKLESVTGADPQFVTALAIAQEAVAGKLADTTLGADSYYAIGSSTPSWVATATPTCHIIHHAFFRTELPAPGGRTAEDLNAAELSKIKGE